MTRGFVQEDEASFFMMPESKGLNPHELAN